MQLAKVKQGQLFITAICIILGVMLAVQFRTTRDIRGSLPYQRLEDLSLQLQQVEKERDNLQKELAVLRGSSTGQSGAYQNELAAVRMGAGLTEVHGPGVLLTIDDSKRPTKPGENPNLYIIHDDDVLKIINELRAAGAEAIAINGQRLVATSEIRCAGPTLSVNNTRYSPPYEIKAIGNSQTMEAALRMRGGVIETLQFWGIQINIKRADDVVIPAYKGIFRFDYAKPTQAGEQ